MKTIWTISGNIYEAENEEDERMLKEMGYRKIASGVGQGRWQK